MYGRIGILGAGLAGNLLAILLGRRGLAVTVYDRGPPPDTTGDKAGRSINLALAARGIVALERAGAMAAVEPLLLPMSGRIVHETDGSSRVLPYGQRSDERIWSVSRADLNRTLYDLARESGTVDYRFGHECIAFDANRLRAHLRHTAGESEIEFDLLLAADGAGSVVRRSLVASGHVDATESLLDHGYKELVIPPAPDGGFALAPGGLHIWPRGGYMLIALPNTDRSFTATLFLPQSGEPGFDRMTAGNVRAFFAREFADVVPLIPGLETEFAERPVGTLGTVHCRPWSRTTPDGRGALLVGDAAHAIVPFHGQGMNAAFEDCAALDALLGEPGSGTGDLPQRFERMRRDDVRAIAEMALENYVEMRDGVRDPDFERRAALAFELERRCPGRFIPRYAMVMFHPEIGYAEAQRRGAVQAAILDAAMREHDPARSLALAESLVDREL
jgi:kynurenine 3-monooxygenase